jgi:hypothetical protein
MGDVLSGITARFRGAHRHPFVAAAWPLRARLAADMLRTRTRGPGFLGQRSRRRAAERGGRARTHDRLNTQIHGATTSESATGSSRAQLAEHLPSGTTIGLVGELGCGKTCFVRGLAAGSASIRAKSQPDVPLSRRRTRAAASRFATRTLPLRGLGRAAPRGLASIGLYDALASPGSHARGVVEPLRRAAPAAARRC